MTLSRHDLFDDSFYLWFQGTPVVDDFKVRQAAHLVLRPLAVNPFKRLLACDAVALHDAMDADILRSRNCDDLVNQLFETRLIEYGTFHPLVPALLEVLRYGRMHDGIDGLCVLF